MFVVVAGSLRVLLPCVCVGAFVRAYLMLTLIWTVGSHFFSLIIGSAEALPILCVSDFCE